MQFDYKRVDNLKREIVDAFGMEAYPGDERIVAADFDEYLEVKRELEGIRWQHLPATTVERLHWIFPFLSPLGFRYYLPAYLIYTATRVMSPDLACEATVFSLCIGEGFSGRFRRFSRSERLAVKHFLEFLRDTWPDEYEDADQAIRDYWSRVK